MEILDAVRCLSALAHASRLEVFRLLVRAGADGMAAGDIARAVAIPANTMSAHLTVLANAGLVTARRDGRSIIYALDPATVRAVLAYVLEDCCGGRPDECAPLLASVVPRCEPIAQERCS